MDGFLLLQFGITGREKNANPLFIHSSTGYLPIGPPP